MTKQRNVFLMVCLLLTSGSMAACDEADELDGASERAWDDDGETRDAKTDDPREACPAIGEARDCEEGEGTQFCGAVDGMVAWSDCLTDFACMPGASEECLLVDGVPALRRELHGVMAEGVLEPEEPEPAIMEKYCYGGSGYSCCDYMACFDCNYSPNPACCDYWTVCQSP